MYVCMYVCMYTCSLRCPIGCAADSRCDARGYISGQDFRIERETLLAISAMGVGARSGGMYVCTVCMYVCI